LQKEDAAMHLRKYGIWIALGAGVGAAFGAAGATMGPAVAYGIAAGVIVALIMMRRRGEKLCG
jgi:hypothetical protein